MYLTRTDKPPAGVILSILTTLILAGLSSCANAPAKEFRFGSPVENDAQAQIAAQSALNVDFSYEEPFTVVKVQQMSYGEYTQLTKQPLNQPANLKVWLVVYFDNKWQSKPPPGGVTSYPSYRGCVAVVVNAADGLPVEVGGPLQPGILTECDK